MRLLLLLSLLAGTITVSWRNPQFKAPEQCGVVDSMLPARVESVRVYGWPRYGDLRQIASKYQGQVRDGLADSLQFDDQGTSWTIFLRAVSSGGAESCDSPLRTVGGALGVPHRVVTPRDTIPYDVTGRRMSGRLPPGCYYTKSGDHFIVLGDGRRLKVPR